MRELRLIDPNGYTVPGAIHLNVPEPNVAEITARLMRDTAPKHAARWDGIGGQRFYAEDYRVQNTPTPTTATSGTFLDWLTTAA